jgi:spermidine synthase
MAHESSDERPYVLERCQTELGELVLRRCGEHHELISDGMFLMDTRDGRSERALIDEVLAIAPPEPRVVIGGLGFGFSLQAAVASAAPTSITVVEIHRQVIEWNRKYLPERIFSAMADPRVRVVCDDIGAWLDRNDEPVEVVCLDTDNGPGWLMLHTNEAIYLDGGLVRLARRLGEHGVLAVWSAHRSAAFESALRRHFADVAIHEVPVTRGAPDVVYVAHRPPARSGNRAAT